METIDLRGKLDGEDCFGIEGPQHLSPGRDFVIPPRPEEPVRLNLTCPPELIGEATLDEPVRLLLDAPRAAEADGRRWVEVEGRLDRLHEDLSGAHYAIHDVLAYRLKGG